MAKSLSGANGDATPNSLDTLIASDIPVGATLSDGTGLPGHSFTATADNTSHDVAGWNLSCLNITPPAEFDGCFKLTIAASERDLEGDISATVKSNRPDYGGRCVGPHARQWRRQLRRRRDTVDRRQRCCRGNNSAKRNIDRTATPCRDGADADWFRVRSEAGVRQCRCDDDRPRSRDASSNLGER